MKLRTTTPAALLLVTALGLAGCSSTPAPSPADSPAASASTAAAPASSPAASPSAPPSAPAPAKAYGTDDLAQIIAGLKDGSGAAFAAIPADQLEKGIGAAKQMIDAAVISPPECAAVVDSNSQITVGSTYASGVSQSAADEKVSVVTIEAVQDPELRKTQIDDAAGNSEKCADFTLEVQGQKVTSKSEVLTVNTAADKSFSTLATQTLPTGQTLTTVTVVGLKGSLTATAVATGSSVTRDAATDLARIVDEALANG